MSRVLVCIDCDDRVEVHELPAEWIDPARYVCGICAKLRREVREMAREQGRQLELVGARAETPSYDPEQARIPF